MRKQEPFRIVGLDCAEEVRVLRSELSHLPGVDSLEFDIVRGRMTVVFDDSKLSVVGIAMAAIGTDAAIETADIALMSDDLSKVSWLILHARRALSIVRQNIVFALGTKVVFLALNLVGAASLWSAIAADMGASLLVIFNGLRLLRR